MRIPRILFAALGLLAANPVAAQTASPGSSIPGIPTRDSLRAVLDSGRESMCAAPEKLLELRADFASEPGRSPTAIAALDPSAEQRLALRDARFVLRADEHQACGVTIAIFDIPPGLASDAARTRLEAIAPTLRWRFARP